MVRRRLRKRLSQADFRKRFVARAYGLVRATEKDIAGYLGMSGRGVRRLASELGVKKKHKAKPGPKVGQTLKQLTQKQISRLFELRRQNYSEGSIAHDLGVSQPAVHYHLSGGKSPVERRGRKAGEKKQPRESKPRFFPVHKKKPLILSLLEETKRTRMLSAPMIAEKAGVSVDYVRRVCREEGPLPEVELKKIGLEISKKKRGVGETSAAYHAARALIAGTDWKFKEIASALDVDTSFVSKANKGKGGDKRIRSYEENIRISRGLKLTKLFSDGKKLELIEKIASFIGWSAKNIVKDEISREEAIDFAKKSLFRKLDYFDPESDTPIIEFLKTYSVFYLLNANTKIRKWSRKRASYSRVKDSRGQISVEQSRESQPLETAHLNLILSEKFKRLLTKRDRAVLQDRFDGMSFRQIAKKHGFSYTTAKKIVDKGIMKLQTKTKIRE